MDSEDIICKRINDVVACLNEYQLRIYLCSEASSIGWGVIGIIHRLTGVSRDTISKGMKECLLPPPVDLRIRKQGGGRKKKKDQYPDMESVIEEIVCPHTMGNPENPLQWVSKSVRKIQAALSQRDYAVSHELVRQTLTGMGYSMQSNRKTKEGGNHPDRDAQFEHINEHVKEFMDSGDPVISVDCKKKELIGEYRNNGQEWRPVSDPINVNVYDFIDRTNGKASPYGVYDLLHNRGWVNVGISSDTASFAVSTIGDWWEKEGSLLYSESKRLYINADGGGSNGSKNRLWKEELQSFSNKTGLEIHVSHFPPGTSKWNKIEHRLFSFISKNWRSKPLESLAVILSLIGETTNEKGLVVTSNIDEKYITRG